MTTLSIHCVSELPAALTDDKGNLLMIEAVASDRWLEKLVRTATIAMGCTAVMASAPIEARHVKAVNGGEKLVHGSGGMVSLRAEQNSAR